MTKRDKCIHLLVSEKEKQQIRERMEQIGIRNRNAYRRKIALNGYCINLDLSDVKELVSLLRRCSNNLNQYANEPMSPAVFIWMTSRMCRNCGGLLQLLHRFHGECLVELSVPVCYNCFDKSEYERSGIHGFV